MEYMKTTDCKNIQVSTKLHKKFKQYCAINGLIMRREIEKMITKVIPQNDNE